jgi:hypothetical protein
VEDETSHHWPRIGRHESGYVVWLTLNSQGCYDVKERDALNDITTTTCCTNETEINDALRLVVAKLLMGEM